MLIPELLTSQTPSLLSSSYSLLLLRFPVSVFVPALVGISAISAGAFRAACRFATHVPVRFGDPHEDLTVDELLRVHASGLMAFRGWGIGLECGSMSSVSKSLGEHSHAVDRLDEETANLNRVLLPESTSTCLEIREPCMDLPTNKSLLGRNSVCKCGKVCAASSASYDCYRRSNLLSRTPSLRNKSLRRPQAVQIQTREVKGKTVSTALLSLSAFSLRCQFA